MRERGGEQRVGVGVARDQRSRAGRARGRAVSPEPGDRLETSSTARPPRPRPSASRDSHEVEQRPATAERPAERGIDGVEGRAELPPGVLVAAFAERQRRADVGVAALTAGGAAAKRRSARCPRRPGRAAQRGHLREDRLRRHAAALVPGLEREPPRLAGAGRREPQSPVCSVAHAWWASALASTPSRRWRRSWAIAGASSRRA